MHKMELLTQKSIDKYQIVWYVKFEEVTMKQHMTNRQEITSLTTAKEGNALIMRKGRTSLLAAKIMLFALLKIENRNEINYDLKDRQYYRNLKLDTTVDYSRGLVAEMDVIELRKLLNKENSGSFYASLRELFSIDPSESKSLRNNFAVMLPNSNSGVLGYAEVITACHYDTSSGRLFLKFSDEDYIKSQLWQIKSEYTSLPLLLFLGIHSIHTYRLLEILYAKISMADEALRENVDELSTEYAFRFSVGELQLMLGIVDITTDKEAKKQAASKDPDWNSIAKEIGERQVSNFSNYKVFRKNSIDVAIKEINESNAAFSVEYDAERDEGGKKISYVNFYVKRKQANKKIIVESNPETNKMNAIVDLARELSALSLTYGELEEIATIANYDKSLVIAGYLLYEKFDIKDSFVDWFKEFRK